MEAYPESVKLYAKLSGVWVDLSGDAISSFTGTWGFNGSSPSTRIADTGTLDFTLNNLTGKYTPNSPTALNGWKKGTEIKLVVTYESVNYIKFYGKIDALSITSSLKFPTVDVQVVDWLDYAVKYPLSNMSIETNKRADYAINKIVSNMPIKPQKTKYDTGVNLFPSIFDGTEYKARAYSELSKIALSELGYIFLTKSRDYGETLVFENNNNRSGVKKLSSIPVSLNSAGRLLAQDGSYLLAEDGSKIVINEIQQFSFNNNMKQVEVSYGENTINQVKVKAYPKKIDTSLTGLFALDDELLIPSSQTVTFRGEFTDGSNKINGVGLVQPVAVTDFTVNTSPDGSGTDITSYCTVTAVYSSNCADFSVYNSYAAHGYLTKLNCRGYGIYSYNPIEVVSENTTSVNAYGYETLTIDQKYQTNTDMAIPGANTILNDESEPKTRLEKLSFMGNSSEDMMLAFLCLDVGSKIDVTEPQTGIDGHFYIQSVDFDISLDGIIKYSWSVVETLSLQKGLSPVEVQFDSGSKQGIDFGYLPKLSNLDSRSYTMWINMNSLDSAITRYGIGVNSDYAGTIFYPSNGGKLRVYTRNETGPGMWETVNRVWNPDEWVFVVMTRTTSQNSAAAPLIYVNGVVQPLTEIYTPIGSVRDEKGSLFVLGNGKTATINFSHPMGGSIKDARVYNRLLDTGEMNILRLNMADITDGLVFQGPCVKTNNVADYDNKTLGSESKIIDNVFGVIGTPSGRPISQLI